LCGADLTAALSAAHFSDIVDRSFLKRTAALAALFLLGSCFGESTGPEFRLGRLAVAPHFRSPHSARLVEIARVRVVLLRPGSANPALDTTVVFPTGQDTLSITLDVPISGSSESFSLVMALIGPAGDTLFRAGPLTVTASSNALTPVVAEPELRYVGTGANAAGVRFVNPPAAAFFGQTVPLVAEAFDSAGVVIPGTPIAFALVNPGDSVRARIPDPGVGSLIAQSQRGVVPVRAVLLTHQTATHSVAIQPVASSIQIQAGNGQNGIVGQQLGQPVIARVVGADALGVQGVIVTFEVTAGGGSLTQLVDTTDANGDASSFWTLGETTGAQSVSATVTGLAGATVIFGATASAGAASRLSFTVQPADVLPAVPMVPAVQVSALDDFGNLVSGFTGNVTIALAANPLGAELSGTLTRAAAGGVASFDDLVLSGAGTGLTLAASAASLAPDTSTSFNITIGTPSRLAIIVQPGNTNAGATITPAVQVAIQDAAGNTVATATDVVTVALENNPGGLGVLSGTTSVAALAGVATFADLSIAQAASGYTIQATAAALTPATSNAFDIAVGPAAVLAFVLQPPAATSPGTPFSVEVEARDAAGNRATSFGGPVSLALGANPAGGTLSGTTSVAAVVGVATFADLSVDNFGDGYTLVAAAAGVSDGASSPFDVTLPATVNAWINLSGGNWSTAANWSRGTVPTAADTVWIKQSGTYTVVFDASATVGRLELGGTSGTQTLSLSSATLTMSDSILVGARGAFEMSGGTLTGGGAMLVAGEFSWSGGTIGGGGGAVRVVSGNSLSISGTAARTLNNFTLELSGAGTWTDNATVNSGSGAVFRVLPGGTLDIQGDPLWVFSQGGAQPVFDVQGAVLRTASGGTATVPGLTVSGTLAVSSGVLAATNNGTVSGTLTVGSGAELRYTSGTQTLTAASSLTGSGTLMVAGGTVNAAGNWGFGGTTQVAGGVLNYNAGSGFTTGLVVSSGTLGGAAGGLLGVSGSMIWTGGALLGSGGGVRVQAGATLAIGGTPGRTLNNYTLELAGTGIWTEGATYNSGSLGRVRVLPTGVFDIQGDPQWVFNQGGAQSVFDVQGTVLRTTSAGTASVPGLSVSGNLFVSSGVLAVNNNATSSGVLDVGALAELRFVSGTQTLDATSSVTGQGTVAVVGGAVNASGAWNFAGLTQVAGGSLNYSAAGGTTGDLAVSVGTLGGAAGGVLGVSRSMTWTGGNLSGAGGAVRVLAGGTLAISGATARTLNNYVLELEGTGSWTGIATVGSGSGGGMRVLAGGELDIQGDPQWSFNQGGAQSFFDVQGTLLRTTSAGTASVPGLSVSGNLFLGSGVLAVNNNATSSGVLDVGALAELRFVSGTQILDATSSVTGEGTVAVVGGTVNANGGWNFAGLTQVAGGTLNYSAAGGTTGDLAVSAGSLGGAAGGILGVTGAMTWSGGNLQGTGGTVRVLAGGSLSVTGTAGRTLNNYVLENAGTNASWTAITTLNSGSGAVLRNLAGASLDVAPAGLTNWSFNQGGATSQFENQGALSITNGANLTLGMPIINTGTVSIAGASLFITSGGTLGSGIVVDEAAALNFTGGNTTLAHELDVSGAGAVGLLNGTLSVAAAGDTVTFERILFQGGTLTNAGLVRVTDLLTWSGSAISGGGGTTRLLAGGNLLLSGTGTRTFTNAVLENGGTAVLDASFAMNSGSGAVLRNLAGATMTISADPSLLFNLGGAAPLFDNQGTLTRSTSAGTVTIGMPFSNGGSFSVLTGTVLFTQGGQYSQAISVTAPGGVSLNGGNHVFEHGAGAAGSGVVLLAGGSLLTGAAADTVDFDRLTLQGGTLGHAGFVRVAVLLDWSGSTISGGGTTRLLAGGNMLLSGTGTRTFTNATLENGGTASWGATFAINSGSGAVLRNLAGATMTISADPSLLFNLGGAAPLFDNQGTLTRSTSAGTVTVGMSFSNSGAVSVSTGTLSFTNGGSHTALLTVTSPGSVNLSGGTHSFANGAGSTGSGLVQLTGGSLVTTTAADTARFTNLTASGGSLAQSGVVRASGVFDWAGGTSLTGGGTTLIAAGGQLQLTGTATRTLSDHTLENGGTGTWSGTFIINSGSGGRIRNLPGGNFAWNSDGSLFHNLGGAQPVFENQGTFSRTGTGTAQLGAFLIDTTGVEFRVEAGTLSVFGGGRLGGNIYSQDVLDFSGGTFSFQDGASLTNDGGIHRVSAGTLTLDSGATINANVLELNGGLITHEGLLEIDEFTWNGGNLTSNSVGEGGTTRAANANLLTGVTRTFSGTHTFEVTATGNWNGAVFNSGLGTVMRVVSDASLQLSGAGGISLNLGGSALFDNQSQVVSDIGAGNTFVLNVPVTSSGTFIVQSGTLSIQNSGTFDGTGSVAAGATYRWNGGTFTYNPATSITGAGTVLLSAGTVNFNGTMNAGSLLIQGGSFIPGANQVTVSGALTTSGAGLLTMTNPSSIVEVGGTATFGGGTSTMNAGTLRVGGNVVQQSNTTAFRPTGTHRTVLIGTAQQHIQFESPPTTFFDVLEIANTGRAVVLQSDVAVNDSLIMQAGGVQDMLLGAGSTERLTVNGVVRMFASTTSPRLAPPVLEMGSLPALDSAIGGQPGAGIHADTVVYIGSTLTTLPMGRPIRYQHLRIAATNPLVLSSAGSFADSIHGDLHISNNGALSVAASSFGVVVAGKLRATGNGSFRMPNAGVTVAVNDSAIFAGGSNNGFLTGGTLRLRGHFAQGGGNSTASFSAGPGHTTVFADTLARRTIAMANPGTGGADSRFGTLFIGASDGFNPRPVAVELLTNIQAELLADSSFGATDTIMSAGFRVITNGLDAVSTVFDGTAVTVNSGQPLGATELTFRNMNPDSDHLVLNRAASASFSGVNFTDTPNPAFFNLRANNTGGSAMTFTFSASTPAAAVMTGPPARYIRTGAVLPQVIWNGTTLP
jgi:hypothetical protein